jgi:aspartyl-tRNA(Asn)/glutamyl-tRNA(Gln) amidotransferase subunit C
MSIDIETIKNVARLARIEIPEEELEHRAASVNGILHWIDKLQSVDTQDVAPLANVSDSELFLREDVVNDGNYRDKILANAPEEMQGFYVVPKVIETEG